MHGRFFVRWLQIMCRVQNGTTLIFKGTRPWRMTKPEDTSIFLVCMYILHFFEHLDDVSIQIWNVGIQIHFKLSRGKIPASRCGTPETMHVRLECTIHLGTLSAHRRLDLDFKWGQGVESHHYSFQMYKALKNGQTWGYINFLSVHAYIAFFGHLDDVWIQIWTVGTSNTLQTFWGKYPPRGVEPQKPCMPYWIAPSTLAHSAPTADLTLIWSEGRVQNDTTPVLKGMGPWKMIPSL
jgi:hypothetical protein